MTATTAEDLIDQAGAHRKPWYGQLYIQVLIAVALGALLGAVYPKVGAEMKPLGDALIKLIKMCIAPIVFLTVVHGIASMSDMKKAGRIGLKTIAYFEFGTILALVVGLTVVNLLRPGVGMNVNVAALDPHLVASYVKTSHEETVVGFLMDIIPNTVVGAFANGDIIQVLFFAVLFALGLQQFGPRGAPVLKLVDDLSKILFKVIGIIMKVAPIGAFGAMAFTVGKFGVGSILTLSNFMLDFYLTCLIFVFVVLGAISKLLGFSIFKLVRYLKEELLLVFGFSGSEPVLPRFMVKMEKLGCPESVVGLVIPTGYSFNLDGTCIYLTMAAIFLAQATNTPLSLLQQLGLLAILLLTSKGATAVQGSGFIVLAGTLSAMGHSVPVASIALILGIDRFMSEARALTNFVGTAVATILVARWEGELDRTKMAEMLG